MRVSALGMPTRSSNSAARASAIFLRIPKWVSSASRICRPIVRTGLRLVIGSWKIMAISRPRIPRSARSLCRIRSRPSNIARPDCTCPLRASKPSTASEVTLFPQPDSPTMPSVSPRAMSNEMPLTAYTVPRRVENSTRRSSTLRSDSLAATKLRVERLAQAVADEVEPEDRDDDGDTRNDRKVHRSLEVSLDVRQHRPPLRRRRVLRTESQEAEASDVDDGGRHRQRALHDHRRHRVREDVRDEDRVSLDTHSARGEHEVGFALSEDRPPQEAREDRDVRHPDGDHDLEEARTKHRHDPDRQQETRNGEHDVHHPHDQRVDEAADVPRRRSEDDPDREARRDSDDADQERVARPVQDARKLVAAKLVDAEPVLAGWPWTAAVDDCGEILLAGIERCEQRREDRHEDEQAHEDESDNRAGIAPKGEPRVAPQSARRLEREFPRFELDDGHTVNPRRNAAGQLPCSGGEAERLRRKSSVPDPRVDDRVRQIHDQIHEDEDDGEKEDSSLKDGIVTVEDRLLEPETDAGPREDCFRQYRPREQEPGLKPDDRRHRQQSVPKHMPAVDGQGRETLGACRTNVVLVLDIEDGSARDASDDRQRDRAQRDPRQDEVLDGVPHRARVPSQDRIEHIEVRRMLGLAQDVFAADAR